MQAEVTTMAVSFTIHFMWIGMATIGGIARYLDRYVRLREMPVWHVLAAHLFVSMFAGYLMAQIAFNIDPQWAWLSAGIGGYLGTEALDWIARFLQTRFGGSNRWQATTPQRLHQGQVPVKEPNGEAPPDKPVG